MSDRMTNARGHDDGEKEQPLSGTYTVPSEAETESMMQEHQPLSEIPANEGGER